jgi:integrase
MVLTDLVIRNAKAAGKTQRLNDGDGLYLEVSPKGGKWWRFKYRIDGKEKRLSLGVHPEVSLKTARERATEARDLLRKRVDPAEQRKAAKVSAAIDHSNSFEFVARDFLKRVSASWASKHAANVVARFERDIFPWLGKRPIREITPPELLTMLRRIEERGAIETAHRALGSCGQVFRYAVASGRLERDPSRDLRGALPPVKVTHFAAVTDPKRVGELLRIIDGYQGGLVVRCALRLAPLVFVRPGELRRAEWAHIDLKAAEWRFTISKTHTQHIVPLARQAVALLTELHPLTNHSRYVFQSGRSDPRPMSDNAVLSALRTLSIGKDEMSGHGFRAMARTILDEVLGFRPDVIEHQLAHAVRDPNGRAYNRTAFLSERRQMMQRWADYLDELKYGSDTLQNRNGFRATAS